MMALSSNVSPVSSAVSSSPTSRRDSTRVCARSSIALSSFSLCDEPVAINSSPRPGTGSGLALTCVDAEHRALHLEQLLQAAVREAKERVHAGAVEGLALGRALDLDIGAGACADHVE